MKTTKVILVAVLMAFAAIGFSQTDHNIKPAPTSQLSVILPFYKAMQNAQLVSAMRAQLNPSFLQTNARRVYTVPVRYKHSIIFVTGTLNQWKRFFRIKETAPRKS